MPVTRMQEAIVLMNSYAERTGLLSDSRPRRYLWTDAFAVCNYLGLARLTGRQEYAEVARELVEQVHHTLGQHREDDTRSGWISGLSDSEGEKHPTLGGLRIGKQLPERAEDDPIDQRLEWDRDGQYFHYLTRWMHALDRVARASRQGIYNIWARELAGTAFDAFSYSVTGEPGQRRMFWKMSIDLARPQVPSMGQHDPLDGYITHLQLLSTATAMKLDANHPDLHRATSAYASMIRRSQMTTEDPLGLGGLLVDAYRVHQMARQDAKPDEYGSERLLRNLLDAALEGLQAYAQNGDYRLPDEHRLAFRELGLAIGLHAVERMQKSVSSIEQHRQLNALARYLPLRDEIEAYWRDPAHQQSVTWQEHRDINEVMLATSLVPEGYLEARP